MVELTHFPRSLWLSMPKGTAVVVKTTGHIYPQINEKSHKLD